MGNEGRSGGPQGSKSTRSSEEPGFVSVPRPTPDDVRRIATAYHFSLSDDEVTTFGALVDATLESYDRLDELVEPIPPVRYPRERGQRPADSGNPLGAWYYRSTIRGADN